MKRSTRGNTSTGSAWATSLLPLTAGRWPELIPAVGDLLLGEAVRVTVGGTSANAMANPNDTRNLADGRALGDQLRTESSQFGPAAAVARLHRPSSSLPIHPVRSGSD